ncbi:MAG: T9SS type A sorting domain-containing protein [Paludibacteraceae bacterium]|nr:T9SS type A sorting domain-containing protein [Paludibacteraceae bacterium]
MKYLKEIILIVSCLLLSGFVMASPEIMVNGEAISKSPTQIKINGDNVNVTFTDGSTLSFDMDDIVVNLNAPTDITTLQNNLFTINTAVGDNLVVTGVKAGKMLSILSVTGISVYSCMTESNETRINISSLASGVYLLNIDGKVVKFIKK